MAGTDNARKYLISLKGKMRFHVEQAEDKGKQWLAREARHKATYAEGSAELRTAKGEDFYLSDLMGAWRFHQDAARMYAAAIEAECASIETGLTLNRIDARAAQTFKVFGTP